MAIIDLLDKSKYVNLQERRERINKCQICPFYLPNTKRCDLCKCFIRQKAKLKKEYEDCPQGFW